MNLGFGCSYSPMESNGSMPAKPDGSPMACITQYHWDTRSTITIRQTLTQHRWWFKFYYKMCEHVYLTPWRAIDWGTDERTVARALLAVGFHRGGASARRGDRGPMSNPNSAARRLPRAFWSFQAKRGFPPWFQNKYCKWSTWMYNDGIIHSGRFECFMYLYQSFCSFVTRWMLCTSIVKGEQDPRIR